VKAKLDGAAKQKHLVHSRQQDAVTDILRTADYLAVFVHRCSINMASPRSNTTSLRILRGAGLGGFRHWTSQKDDRTGTGYNPLAGSAGREEARAPGTPLR